MLKQKLILSPCGTSILTNNKKVFEELGIAKNLSKYSNLGEKDIEKEKRELFQKALKSIEDDLTGSGIAKIKEHSAELNAIYTIESDKLSQNTIHILLRTDTFLGDATAKIVENLLKKEGVRNVQSLHIQGLRTCSVDEFRLALADLVKVLDETLTGYRESGYEIVFNLTGGFKSIQGFLQSIAPFYADRCVYIFEGGTDLLTIPTLPVKQADLEEIETHLYTMRRLALALACSADDVEKISKIYWWELDGDFALTEWGTLAFKKAKRVLYERDIYPAPSPKILIPKKVKQTLERSLDKKRKREFNKTMDDLALHMETGQSLKSSRFKALQGDAKPSSTHECYLNSDNAERIFCHYEEDRLVIDEVGEHL